MLTEQVERIFKGYRREQLFDIAADVERYPEFLPWWIAARINKREVAAYETDQILGLGPLRVRFGSKTKLTRPYRIDVTSNEPPFRQFKLSWIFEPQPDANCKVGLITVLEFRSRLLERLMGQVLPAAIADIIAAFEARAREEQPPR
jgi:coenzyme Q-binding protein COQ10